MCGSIKQYSDMLSASIGPDDRSYVYHTHMGSTRAIAHNNSQASHQHIVTHPQRLPVRQRLRRCISVLSASMFGPIVGWRPVGAAWDIQYFSRWCMQLGIFTIVANGGCSLGYRLSVANGARRQFGVCLIAANGAGSATATMAICRWACGIALSLLRCSSRQCSWVRSCLCGTTSYRYHIHTSHTSAGHTSVHVCQYGKTRHRQQTTHVSLRCHREHATGADYTNSFTQQASHGSIHLHSHRHYNLLPPNHATRIYSVRLLTVLRNKCTRT